ncbi:unnamed protein product [Ixodes hexagonus]
MTKSLLSNTSRQALAPNGGKQMPVSCNARPASRESSSAESRADLCSKSEKIALKAESFKALDTKAESCLAPSGQVSWLGHSTSWSALSQEHPAAAFGEDYSGAPKDDLVAEDNSPIQSFRCSKQSPPPGFEEGLLVVPDVDDGANDSDNEIEGMFPEPDEEPQWAVLGDLYVDDGKLGMLRDVCGRSWKPCVPQATPPRSPSPLRTASPDSLPDFESFKLPFITEALQYVPFE